MMDQLIERFPAQLLEAIEIGESSKFVLQRIKLTKFMLRVLVVQELEPILLQNLLQMNVLYRT